MGRRSRVLLIVFGGLILMLAANGLWSHWHALSPLEIGPPTDKPIANFVPLRPVGDVPMPLQATNADGSAFTSSTIVTSAAHPSGVAYLAGWRRGASLRIGSLDLACGKPMFPVVDLGAGERVYQLAARPEGILIAGLKPTDSPHPELLPAAYKLEVHLVALDPSTGQVRWEARVRYAGQLFAHLYPYGVLAANGLDAPALLDWTSSAPRWTDNGNPDAGLPPVTWVEPQLTAPLATAAERNSSTPGDPRLAVLVGDNAWIIDTQTGNWTAVTYHVGSGSSWSVTPELIIGGSVYVTADFGRDGEVLYRFPADPPQPVDKGESLWATTSAILATTPCGANRLCLTVGNPGTQTGHRIVVIDTGSRRNRALPDTVPTGGYAIGDRYVDPAGRVYDLTGVLLGVRSPLANAWWLTPGSLVGIDTGDPAGTVGATPHATIVAVSTVDGRRTVLGQLLALPYQVTTGNGYLVYADGDGFHALQYAQP
jgi:hypothetical protein